MSIDAQLPSHRSEISELFIRDAATLLLLSARSCSTPVPLDSDSATLMAI